MNMDSRLPDNIFFFNVGATAKAWLKDYPPGTIFVDRRWENSCRFNFMSAGYGERFSRQLYRLRKKDIFLAFVTEYGYVGIGEVVTEAVPINDFRITHSDTRLNGKSLMQIKDQLCETNLLKWKDDILKREHVVGVRWIKKLDWECNKDFKPALWERRTPKLFATTHIVCSLKNQPATIEYVYKNL